MPIGSSSVRTPSTISAARRSANHEPTEISPTFGDRVAWFVVPIYRQHKEKPDLLFFVLYECYPLRRDRVSAVAGEHQRLAANGVRG